MTERRDQYSGVAAAIRESLGMLLVPTERVRLARDRASMRATLGEAMLAETWAEGRAMTLEQAVAYALDEPPPA